MRKNRTNNINNMTKKHKEQRDEVRVTAEMFGYLLGDLVESMSDRGLEERDDG